MTADELRNLLSLAGISQAELARRTGLSRHHVNKMVLGKVNIPEPTAKFLHIILTNATKQPTDE